MPDTGSITRWLDDLKAGAHPAAHPVWERYWRRLVALARQRLQGSPRAMADEEDVALSAFDSFCRGAEQGRFPQLCDRSNLWQLLVVITARKASALAKHERRQKRGGGAGLADDAARDLALAEVVGREPAPEFAAEVAEQCGRLLARLDDPALREIALWKMEGYTSDEIADRLGCVPRTVERRLRVIRSLWNEEDFS
jgi:DNA-directed RNA polymerase specialized sigma24 family protein